eukprot:3400446-Alexandrium_andersonii.AAC.1
MLRASLAIWADIRPSSASSIGSSCTEVVSIASPVPSPPSRSCTCGVASSTKALCDACDSTTALPEAPVGGPTTGPEAPVGGHQRCRKCQLG